MATPQVLGQLNPSANVLSVLYTVPGATNVVSSSILICNQDSAGSSFSVSIAVAGAVDTPKQYIFSGSALLGNDTVDATMGITLGPGDVVRVLATTANVSFNLFGVTVP